MSRKPILYSRIIRSDETPRMVRWLLKSRFARSETQAVLVLLLITAISTGFAVYFFVSANFIPPANFQGDNFPMMNPEEIPAQAQ